MDAIRKLSPFQRSAPEKALVFPLAAEENTEDNDVGIEEGALIELFNYGEESVLIDPGKPWHEQPSQCWAWDKKCPSVDGVGSATNLINKDRGAEVCPMVLGSAAYKIGRAIIKVKESTK